MLFSYILINVNCIILSVVNCYIWKILIFVQIIFTGIWCRDFVLLKGHKCVHNAISKYPCSGKCNPDFSFTTHNSTVT